MNKIKTKQIIYITSVIIIILVVTLVLLKLTGVIKSKVFTAADFRIETVISNQDYNQNGVDDYTDILLGARADAKNKPRYKSGYYAGGYPPEDEGVCTDVVWRAFTNAGYSLKHLVDEDIKNNLELYPRVEGKADPNIDFRRVPNLKVFFDRNAVSYSLNPNDIEEWQPGDIVIFGKNYRHIAIVSNKRNKQGITYMIHNAGQIKREEDALLDWKKDLTITGHYRFERSR